MQYSIHTRPVNDTIFEHCVTIWNTGSGYSIILVNDCPGFKEREGPLPCSKPNKSAEFSPLLQTHF